MEPRKINPDIYWIGVNDSLTDLFEGLWDIRREGVSYNAYLIRDKKTTLIDLVREDKSEEFLTTLERIISPEEIDYVVVNHMEPDHSGSLRILRRINPRFTILGTEKTLDMLREFYHIKERVEKVEDGEEISLGRNKLKFFHTPFLHWPETMVTYEVNSCILFSCDAFGGYGILKGGIFDEDYPELTSYLEEAFRYYANIVTKFSRPVIQAINKLKEIEIKTIAPSHGLIWRKNPALIVEQYLKWAGYGLGEGERGITILYGSMYGNTKRIINIYAQEISRSGIPLEIFDSARVPVSYILPSLLRYKGVVIGAPTYEGTIFPPLAHVLRIATHKGIKNKKFIYAGSFGWRGGGEKELLKILEPSGWEMVDKIVFSGAPSEEDIKKSKNTVSRLIENL